MIKIGILTFHASHNYGSMLQAWALQRYLKSIGLNVETINLRTKKQKSMFPNPLGHLGPNVIKHFLNEPKLFLQNTKKWYKFENFLRKKLSLTKKEYTTWNDILNDLPVLRYNAIISGGDQIWNPECIDYDISYYLPSKDIKVKKISYAPSMGGYLNFLNNNEVKDNIIEYLNDFDYLSVREETTKTILEKLLTNKIISVPDPTFLLSKDDYLEIFEDKPLIKGEYLFYYTPWTDKNSERIAREISKQYNLPIVITNANNNTRKENIIIYNSVGPSEFLNILYNAKFVCGQSFHLLIFSLIFNKDFAIINGDKDLRIKDLLNKCKLSDRAISIEHPIIKNYSPIDFNLINNILLKIRKEGIDFINTWNI